MKILLGVDDSNFAPTLVQAIATQFRSNNTDVLVLHVLQPIGPPPPQMGPGYAPELEAENKLAQELVQRTASDLRAAGFKAETMVGIGDIREGIIDS
jgi:Universal stress protein family